MMNKARHYVKHKLKRIDSIMELVRTLSSVMVLAIQIIILTKFAG